MDSASENPTGTPNVEEENPTEPPVLRLRKDGKPRKVQVPKKADLTTYNREYMRNYSAQRPSQHCPICAGNFKSHQYYTHEKTFHHQTMLNRSFETVENILEYLLD